MNHSVKVGFSFGLTSSVITTLGLMTGLYSGTGSKAVVLGGILVIAVADAMSDAMGIHISEESHLNKNVKEVWQATIATFLSKFLFALTFVIPFLFLTIKPAIYTCFVWGLFLLAGYSIYLAKKRNMNPVHIVTEHLAIAVVVMIVTYYVGMLANILV
jgi:vacuolar iron transporter family protein